LSIFVIKSVENPQLREAAERCKIPFESQNAQKDILKTGTNKSFSAQQLRK
jgi:hypothetical protein